MMTTPTAKMMMMIMYNRYYVVIFSCKYVINISGNAVIKQCLETVKYVLKLQTKLYKFERFSLIDRRARRYENTNHYS